MKKPFTTELYVKVVANSFIVSLVAEPAQEQVFNSLEPFTTQRLLVGQFLTAEHCLKRAISAVVGKHFIPRSVALVVHPLEMVEGGLSEVEDRLFRELCLGAGARKVVLWVGAELNPQQVSELLGKA